jgi:hypothetical protein
MIEADIVNWVYRKLLAPTWHLEVSGMVLCLQDDGQTTRYMYMNGRYKDLFPVLPQHFMINVLKSEQLILLGSALSRKGSPLFRHSTLLV